VGVFYSPFEVDDINPRHSTFSTLQTKYSTTLDLDQGDAVLIRQCLIDAIFGDMASKGGTAGGRTISTFAHSMGYIGAHLLAARLFLNSKVIKMGPLVMW
jgi:hypothetical protein